jgi:hypothetical protein
MTLCAGLGLFVDGEVPVGSVVAVLPGVTYTSTQLTRMPNYPKVGNQHVTPVMRVQQ